jgi:teichuronic acid exporter
LTISDPPNPSQNLSKLAISGFGWQFLSRVGRQGIQFVISIILARLLLPSDYGLVGMVAIFITLTLVASDLGFTGAVVQKKDVTDEQLQTVFWLNNLLSLGLWGLSWLFAPLVARFYNEPILSSILIASTLGMVLMAPSGVPRSLIYKQMQFRDSFIIDWAGMLVGGAVSIALAFGGVGVWSLVWGNLASALIVSLIVWRFCRWRPRWIFNLFSVKEMTGFSLYYFGTRVFQSLTGNLDYMIIGKFFTASQLGFYFLAFRLMELPRVQLGLTVRSVVYPILIRFQEDNKRTQVVLYQLGLSVSLIVFPVLVGLMTTAPDFILVIYGPKWVESTSLLQLLGLSGIISSVDQTTSVMNARGKSGWVFFATLGKMILFLTLILPGTAYGLNFVAALVSLHAVLTVLFFQYWVNHLTGFNYWRYFRSLAPATFASIIMCIMVIICRHVLIAYDLDIFIILFFQVVVGCIAYGLSLILWPKDDILNLMAWLHSQIPALSSSKLFTSLMASFASWKIR